MEATPRPQMRMVPSARSDSSREHFSIPRPLNLRNEDFSAFRRANMNVKAAGSEEVVLFALHPHTIIKPLKARIYKKVNETLEMLIATLQMKGYSRNEVLAKLHKTRWLMKLFDYDGISSLVNVFKTYLCHSDALVVPLTFKDVYEAYGAELSKAYTNEVVRHNINNDLDNRRAFIMGGIDFTEETVLSTYRQTSTDSHHGTASVLRSKPSNFRNFNSIMPTISNHMTPELNVALSNRDFFVDDRNITLFESFIPKLKKTLARRKELIAEAQAEYTQRYDRVKLKRQELLLRSYSIVQNYLQERKSQFENTLNKLEIIFNPDTKYGLELNELNTHMLIIDQAYNFYSNIT